ncbi:uncharacterized protein GIQ15_05831 [Arthroderma uncinatum]|uniref:uncharacterized protein n=1 Tax=Arthroderma uncinatum TaxID=74035 RepID=UPI00144AC142|nr:uncharacterized protein GIQ15_05831 [Arthroderma uncinatum]KAF3480484.1 hypothetical protein GIQ15_05831 [Arthroderma uncinatum]
MPSQSFASANIIVMLRQLRSLCHVNANQAASASPFTFSSPPSRFVSFRAYSSYAVTHRARPTTSTSAITRQWQSTPFYSTSAPRPPKPTKKPNLEDVIPQIPQPTKPKKPQPAWGVQKKALKSKFEEGWKPRKKLSPDTMESVRKLHSMDSVKFSTKNLSEQFKVSPEAIRRILKSKWRATEAEEVDRRERWEKRKIRIREQMTELGLRRPDGISKKSLDNDKELSRRSKNWGVTDKELVDIVSEAEEDSPPKY